VGLVVVGYVDTVEYTSAAGTKALLEITHSQMKDSNGELRVDESGEPVMEQFYKVNGKDYATTEASQLYQALIGYSIHSQIDKNWRPSGQPAASIVFDLNDKTSRETLTINFYEYELDYYAVEVDGEIDFKVVKNKIDNIDTVYQQLINGEFAEE